MAEIFDFQDRIREEIVAALRLKLTQTDKTLTKRKPTENVEAYDLFLRGRSSYYCFTSEELLEARNCLERAIEIDPNFAEAYGYLSFCHFQGWASNRPTSTRPFPKF
jgi:adenylate cyclase